MFPLLLLGVLGGASGTYMVKNGMEQKDLTPRIFGMPATTVGIGAGLLALLLGPPGWATMGAILASTSYVAKASLDATKEGLDAMIARQVQAAIQHGGGGAPQLPPPSPPMIPDSRKPGGFLEMLTTPFRGRQEEPAPS